MNFHRDSEDTALLLLREIYAPLGIRPRLPGEISREPSLPPRSAVGPPPTAGATPGPPPTNSYQPPPSFQSPVANYQHPPSVNNTPLATNFQSPSPMQHPAGPPPPMFAPTPLGTPTSGTPGVRRSPYVPPDFSNLPNSQGNSPAGLPPTGPAPVGGYRRTN